MVAPPLPRPSIVACPVGGVGSVGGSGGDDDWKRLGPLRLVRKEWTCWA